MCSSFFGHFASPFPSRTCLVCARALRRPQADDTCRQCMVVTTIEQEDAWKDCFQGSTIVLSDSCSRPTAMTCCLVEIGNGCLENDLFSAYAECFIEEESGGAGCPALACDQAARVSAAVIAESAAGRSASPPPQMNGVGSFVMAATLGLVAALCFGD